MEKRSHTRRPVQLFGRFSTSSATQIACEVSDFCSSGMFIRFRSSSARQLGKQSRPKRNEIVEIQFNTTQGEPHLVRAKVMRSIHDAMGVAFESITEDALLALNVAADEYVRKNTVLSQSNTTINHARRSEIASKLREILLRNLTPLLDTVFNSLDEALLDAANHASNDTKQRHFFDIKNQLRSSKNSIKGRFLMLVREQIDAQVGLAVPINPDPIPQLSTELSLVDKEELEEWLIAKVIISKAESKYRELLIGVRTRIKELIIQPSNDYLGSPEFICRTFQEAIQEIKLHLDVEKIIYRCFEKFLILQLQPMYEQLNEMFIAAGILPELNLRKLQKEVDQKPTNTKSVSGSSGSSNEHGKQASRATAEERSGTQPSTHPSSPYARVDLEEPVSNIGAQQHASSHPLSAATANSTTTVGNMPDDVGSIEFSVRSPESAKTVLKALRQIQEQSLHSSDMVQKDLKQTVAQLVVGEQGQSSWQNVERDVSRSLDRVSQLFKYFANYEVSVEKIQPWLDKLKIPLSRVLVQDKSFLFDKQHPARKLLDQLANFAQKGGPATKEQESSIEQFVDNVIRSGDASEEVFEQALNQLEPIVARQELVFERNVERLVKACEGQEKIDFARRAVAQELNDRLSGKDVPNILLGLLDSGWRNLLALDFIKHGEESQVWQQNLDLFDQLLRYLNQIQQGEGVVAEGVGFISQLREKLTASGVGSVHQETLVNTLEALFVDDQELGAVRKLDVTHVSESGIDAQQDQPFVGSKKSEKVEALSKWSRRVKRMELGDWLVAVDEHDQAEYRQLAWANNERSRFVFVNQKGVKSGDYKLVDLIDQLDAGKLELRYDDAPPMVDQGLNKMVQQIYEEVANKGSHDEDTGLAGRQYLERVLQRAFVNAKRGRSQHVVAYLSIQRFKLINTKCGFAAGDCVLKEIGAILLKNMGKTAIVSHIGGDEFCVLQRNCTVERAYSLASKTIEAVEKYRYTHKQQPFTLGLNVGLMLIDQKSESVQGILDAAANACAVLQRLGENRIKVYQQGDHEVAKNDDQSQWMMRINSIMENDLLHLRCQRIQPVGTGCDVLPHYEVLLGLVDEEGKILPPADLINAAERYNRMEEIDQWVIRNTLQWMASNRRALDDLSGLSINLSGQSVSSDALLEFIFEQFANSGAPRNKVCFEVTETEAISSIHDAADFIHEMKQLGCRFSLDDFGAGLSSYAYLKHLPVDYLKIDGSLIKDILTAPYDYAMVKSICEVGHFMGKKVVAEYVENDEILSVLQEIGVDYAQGYGIEKPKLLSELVHSFEVESA